MWLPGKDETDEQFNFIFEFFFFISVVIYYYCSACDRSLHHWREVAQEQRSETGIIRRRRDGTVVSFRR